MLNNELRRAFKSKGMLLTLLIGMVICIGYIVSIYKMQAQMNERIENVGEIYIQMTMATPFDYWVLGHATKYKIYLYYFMPVLAVLPYAGSFCQERKSGYCKNVLVRTGRFKYMVAKYISSFLAGGTAVTLPILINLMWTFTYKAYQKPMPGGNTNLTFGSGELLGKLYFQNPFLYCGLYLIAIFIFCGGMAAVTLLVSTVCGNIFTVMLIPFLINIFTTITVSYKKASYLYSSFLDPSIGGYKYVYGIVVCIAIVAVTFVGSTILQRKRDVL